MSAYWSRGIAELETYVPGEQPQDAVYVKLNTNESPYPPSPRVIAAIKEAANERLRLYPDPSCAKLRDAIAAYHGLGRDEVFVGNGSDEILAFAFAAFLDHGEAILFPDITYSFYSVYSRFFRLKAELIPVERDFSIPVALFLKPNGGIVLSNPNAPTSMGLPLSEIRRILDYNKKIDRVVIVDEAYVDFGAESAVGLIGDYPNLLVIQTLSKSRSLAGLRVGFALGSPGLIEGLERVKSSINSYTVDRLALAGAVEAMGDEAHFRATTERIMATRSRVTRELKGLGFSVLDSQANFIFISHPEVPAKELYRRLKEGLVLVRYFNKPRIDNHLRVSIGNDVEMDVLLTTLRGILAHAAD
jgi:histidinol-phosphate aminotransferase